MSQGSRVKCRCQKSSTTVRGRSDPHLFIRSLLLYCIIVPFSSLSTMPRVSILNISTILLLLLLDAANARISQRSLFRSTLEIRGGAAAPAPKGKSKVATPAKKPAPAPKATAAKSSKTTTGKTKVASHQDSHGPHELMSAPTAVANVLADLCPHGMLPIGKTSERWNIFTYGLIHSYSMLIT